jgi:hypothetical protein
MGLIGLQKNSIAEYFQMINYRLIRKSSRMPVTIERS